MQLSDLQKHVLETRYLHGELFRDMVMRVAHAVSRGHLERNKCLVDLTEAEIAADELELDYISLLSDNLFWPNSPTLMNAGRNLGQLAACFVLPIEDDMTSIYETLLHTALIHKSGGGTGFNFSRLRPKGDYISSTGGASSGPISFMKVYDAGTEAVKQGGTRRGANMGMLRVDHPDIIEFIRCKNVDKLISNFNISVAVTDAFMQALMAGHERYPLINPRTGDIHSWANTKEVFELIVEQAWLNGEPGVVFIDEMNRHNPTLQHGLYEATNPCGEQPLLPYESCNLGSINLSSHVEEGQINWDKLSQTVQISVHFLNDVIDVNRYPLPIIEETTKRTRKIGLGVMGYADMLIMLGLRYDSEEALEMGSTVAKFIQEVAHQTSEAYGYNNATCTTVAPTGSISIIAGTSGGIEPIFRTKMIRRHADAEIVEYHPLYAKMGGDAMPAEDKALFRTADDVDWEWHIRHQAAWQEHVDNAISKTINLRSDATKDEVREAIFMAYRLNCKGITVYRDQSRDGQPLSDATKTTAKTETNGISEARERPEWTFGGNRKVRVACGNLYVDVHGDDIGVIEAFVSVGKHGGCPAQSEALGRVVSAALQSGMHTNVITHALKGIRCNACTKRNDLNGILSCPDALGKTIELYEQMGFNPQPEAKSQLLEPKIQTALKLCPNCKSELIHGEGCVRCTCGYDACNPE